MMDPRWQNLLEEARAAHADIAELSGFCAFPDDIATQRIVAKYDPICDRMRADPGLESGICDAFRAALSDVAPLGYWRDTYRGTPLGDRLHEHFGCFEILGKDAPFTTGQMRGFVIYQTAGYHYPSHRHPAEELYLVLAGEGEFAAEDRPARRLGPGGTAFHASNQTHALTTHDHPVLAYVLWRGDLETRPVFTHPEGVST